MLKEHSVNFKSSKGEKGIIQTHGMIILNIERGDDFGFQYLDLCPEGDLMKFMDSGKLMTSKQKLILSNLSLAFLNKIHARGEIDRDVSYNNIFVMFNASNDSYEPILIEL